MKKKPKLSRDNRVKFARGLPEMLGVKVSGPEEAQDNLVIYIQMLLPVVPEMIDDCRRFIANIRKGWKGDKATWNIDLLESACDAADGEEEVLDRMNPEIRALIDPAAFLEEGL